MSDRAREPWRATKAQLEAARGKAVPDVIREGLDVLFCGINPGLYSGAVGHHFARPGNRFWKTLHAAGFTDRLLSPFDERALLPLGLGVTNIVNRATATADELSAEELRCGAREVERKLRRYRPAVFAVCGVGAYRVAFRRPRAPIGPQSESIAGTRTWVLPNPSGLNASYQDEALQEAYRELRRSVAPR